jgi:hypothetical protein
MILFLSVDMSYVACDLTRKNYARRAPNENRRAIDWIIFLTNSELAGCEQHGHNDPKLEH